MKKPNILYSGLFKIIFAFLTILTINSCLDPEWDFEKFSDEVVLSPGVAAPLAYGSLSMDDMLNEFDSTDYIKRFDNGLLYITYVKDLFSYPANEVIDIPDQNFLEFFIESDVAISSEWISSGLNDTVRFEKQQEAVFAFNHNERIDSMHLKTVDMRIDVESSFRHTGILSITSDNILIDGEPFNEVIQISDASGNFSYSRTITMDEHTVYLENNSQDNAVLPLDFELKLINSGNNILPGESCNISMSFIQPEFYSVFGYLGDYELLLSQEEVVLDVYDTDDLEGGSLFFADPIVNVNVSNSYGIPVEIEIADLETYSRINDITESVILDPDMNPFFIDAPELSAIGDTANSGVEINRGNSNILEVMETFPKEFTYTVSAITNPEGSGANYNFATDSSNLNVDFEVILPLWIKAEGFSMQDTSEFDFEEMFGETSDIIDYLRLTLDATNGLPVEVDMQLYFTDGNYNMLDSLFLEEDFLLPPTLDGNSKVDNPAEHSKSVEFSNERLIALEPAEFIIIKATATTAEASADKYVKFFSDYTVDFKLKMRADLKINSREL